MHWKRRDAFEEISQLFYLLKKLANQVFTKKCEYDDIFTVTFNFFTKSINYKKKIVDGGHTVTKIRVYLYATFYCTLTRDVRIKKLWLPGYFWKILLRYWRFGKRLVHTVIVTAITNREKIWEIIWRNLPYYKAHITYYKVNWIY